MNASPPYQVSKGPSPHRPALLRQGVVPVKPLVCLLLLLGLASPGAALDLVEIDPAAQDINATAYDTSLTIDGTHVWVCYVDSALRIVLADGTLPSPVW